MNLAKLLKQQLRAAGRLALNEDERALVAWWESQIDSIEARAPKLPEHSANPEHPGQQPAA